MTGPSGPFHGEDKSPESTREPGCGIKFGGHLRTSKNWSILSSGQAWNIGSKVRRGLFCFVEPGIKYRTFALDYIPALINFYFETVLLNH